MDTARQAKTAAAAAVTGNWRVSRQLYVCGDKCRLLLHRSETVTTSGVEHHDDIEGSLALKVTGDRRRLMCVSQYSRAGPALLSSIWTPIIL